MNNFEKEKRFEQCKPLRQTAASVLANQTDDKTDDRHDGENKEQDFGDFNGTRCDAAKAEDGCD